MPVLNDSTLRDQESERACDICRRVYDLYKHDALIIHSIPIEKLKDQSAHKPIEDDTSLVSGSILFYKGLRHKPTDTPLRNAVARFGDRERVRATLLGSLHDLDKVWMTHEVLESGKPDHKKAEQPFVFFTNCDMFDPCECLGKQPWGSYADIHLGEKPEEYQRTKGFDFRKHVEEQEWKDNTKLRGEHVEWNEIRAALNLDNQVGLCYIHDPAHHPGTHEKEIQTLKKQFGDENVKVFVFKVDEPEGVTGDLMYREMPDGSGIAVPYEEYIAAFKADAKEKADIFVG